MNYSSNQKVTRIGRFYLSKVKKFNGDKKPILRHGLRRLRWKRAESLWILRMLGPIPEESEDKDDLEEYGRYVYFLLTIILYFRSVLG